MLFRTLLPILIASVLPAACCAQEEERFAAGRRYLARIGRDWAERAPFDQRFCLYSGRACVGSSHLHVERQEEGGAIVFTFRHETRMNFPKTRFNSLATGRFAAGLELLDAEVEIQKEGSRLRMRYRVEADSWRREASMGESELPETRGPRNASRTLGGLFFPLMPTDDEVAWIDALADTPVVVRRVPGLHPAPHDPERKPLACYEAEVTSVAARMWGDEGGRVVHYGCSFPAAHLRWLPVDVAEFGRDLPGELELAEPSRAVIDLLRAFAKNDDRAVLARIDLPALARAWYPDCDGQEVVQEKDVHEELRSALLGPVRQAMRKNLELEADEPRLEDVHGPTMECTIQDDHAEVVVLRGQVYRLRRAHSGERTGQWLVVDIEEL